MGGLVAASLTTVLEAGQAAIGPVQFDEYDFDVDPTLGPLQSITVHGGINTMDIFAVSGIDPVEAVPEPHVWAMFLAAAGTLYFVRRVKA